MTKTDPLLKYLANLGYGTRREVTFLFKRLRVTDAHGAVLLPEDRCPHDDVRVDNEPLDPPPSSVILLNKPLGYVCSTTDSSNPVVYDLLPFRFRLRSPIIAPVGRLDRDTSGLLIMTDDGQVNHRLTSPRSHVSKTYAVTLSEAIRGDEQGAFASGTMMLDSESEPLLPVQLHVTNTNAVTVTLFEGKYHQVRRMFAALGHHVTQLERIAIGALPLGNQTAGTWRVLTPLEFDLLMTSSPPTL